MGQFEGELYAGPEKTEFVEQIVLEHVSDEEEGHEDDQPDEPIQSLYHNRATTSGRLTGEILRIIFGL